MRRSLVRRFFVCFRVSDPICVPFQPTCMISRKALDVCPFAVVSIEMKVHPPLVKFCPIILISIIIIIVTFRIPHFKNPSSQQCLSSFALRIRYGSLDILLACGQRMVSWSTVVAITQTQGLYSLTVLELGELGFQTNGKVRISNFFFLFTKLGVSRIPHQLQIFEFQLFVTTQMSCFYWSTYSITQRVISLFSLFFCYIDYSRLVVSTNETNYRIGVYWKSWFCTFGYSVFF